MLFEGPGGGGHERGLPAGREKDASEASQDGPLEAMGSFCTSVRSLKGRSVAGAKPSHACDGKTKWSSGQVDTKNVTEKLVVEGDWLQKRLYVQWLVRLEELSMGVTMRKARRGTDCITAPCWKEVRNFDPRQTG